MSAEEARAEARGEAWASYRKDVQPNPLHFERERVAFKAGWDARDWQASREVTEAEVEAAARSIDPGLFEDNHRASLRKFIMSQRRDALDMARAALEAAREVRS